MEYTEARDIQCCAAYAALSAQEAYDLVKDFNHETEISAREQREVIVCAEVAIEELLRLIGDISIA